MMKKLPVVKDIEFIRVLLKLGFEQRSMKGSHASFKHPDGRVTTIALHKGRDIPRGTLRSMLRDISLTTEEFIYYLKK